jgi:ribosome-associated protein
MLPLSPASAETIKKPSVKKAAVKKPVATKASSAKAAAPRAAKVKAAPPVEVVKPTSYNLITTVLDDAKAENIVSIDLHGKTSLADYMIVATGRSDRHVGAIASQIISRLKDEGFGNAKVEGMPLCEWVLIDAGDIIVHIFRPEVRNFYNLEKMWSGDRPDEKLREMR